MLAELRELPSPLRSHPPSITSPLLSLASSMRQGRQPMHRAALEGQDVEFSLSSMLDELKGILSPLGSHPPPSTLSFLNLTTSQIVGCVIVLTSPHRNADHYPKATARIHVLPFSKKCLLVDLLGVSDSHNEPDFTTRRVAVHRLEIDLLQPIATRIGKLPTIFSVDDLSPMFLFRHLTYLKIEGMTESYQDRIWQCVWLNPNLHVLILSMSIDGEILSTNSIRETRLQAEQRAYVNEKFSIGRLELTKFVVSRAPFDWFDGKKLKHIDFIQCEDAGFRLDGLDWGNTTVVTDPRNGEPKVTSTNLMRRPNTKQPEVPYLEFTEEQLTTLRRFRSEYMEIRQPSQYATVEERVPSQ